MDVAEVSVGEGVGTEGGQDGLRGGRIVGIVNDGLAGSVYAGREEDIHRREVVADEAAGLVLV